MPKELTASPAWDTMPPGDNQAWLLDQALDRKREILAIPLSTPHPSGAGRRALRKIAWQSCS
jgi:hypothetical protein